MILKEAIMAYIQQQDIYIYIYVCVCVCIYHGDSSSGRCRGGNEGN